MSTTISRSMDEVPTKQGMFLSTSHFARASIGGLKAATISTSWSSHGLATCRIARNGVLSYAMDY